MKEICSELIVVVDVFKSRKRNKNGLKFYSDLKKSYNFILHPSTY